MSKKGRFVVLERYSESDRQTLGKFHVCESNGDIVETFESLELPFRQNRRNISCIPVGEYPLEKRYSVKHKNHLHVKDVPNRSYILVHTGTYHWHTLGCILVGKDLVDLNKDSFLDLIKSMFSMQKIMNMLPKRTKIIVRNQ